MLADEWLEGPPGRGAGGREAHACHSLAAARGAPGVTPPRPRHRRHTTFLDAYLYARIQIYLCRLNKNSFVCDSPDVIMCIYNIDILVLPIGMQLLEACSLTGAITILSTSIIVFVYISYVDQILLLSK